MGVGLRTTVIRLARSSDSLQSRLVLVNRDTGAPPAGLFRARYNSGIASRSPLWTLGTTACWTFAGGVLGIVVAMILLDTTRDGRPSPYMCGNSALDPGVGYGLVLGFVGGCIAAATRRRHP